MNHFAAGALAGLTVDLALFPLDTIKTRLQSPQGFWAAGGPRLIYRGLLPALLGSVPTAAVFFAVYEHCKASFSSPKSTSSAEIETSLSDSPMSSSHSSSQPLASHPSWKGVVLGSALGEMASGVVRVPLEVWKQHRQAMLLRPRGFRWAYRGLVPTVLRDICFSVLQCTVWEHLKRTGVPSAVSGSIAGALAALLTTPLDLWKTRRMLSTGSSSTSALSTLSPSSRPRTVNGWFRGAVPRTLSFGLGGFIFLGAYDFFKHHL